ncbi:aspartate 1-decarboxylase [Mucisphaera calidilacus]|uniref:Aspartate 1-decarboxylase n=1 Tax=Mucisphaera calidilacus TaxID=2527982 RepID=A0A518BXE0_9BACT|nr:aspartate 1-decarboxylase [Mucisphaera calidilacus]QDU71614.1 Aspartate 1-decarboxylase precursor [Mucisphaera calidilacus]
MLRTMLLGKIHRATITQCDPDYIGSITIDADLLEAAGMLPNERVLVADLDNAVRFETYIILGERGSGIIGVNGAAAHTVAVGQKVIIMSFGQFENVGLEEHEARVVVADERNHIAQTLSYPSSLSGKPQAVESGS